MLLDEMHDLLLVCQNYNYKAIGLVVPLVALYLAYVYQCDQPCTIIYISLRFIFVCNQHLMLG
jgi:hypothetical protein